MTTKDKEPDLSWLGQDEDHECAQDEWDCMAEDLGDCMSEINPESRDWVATVNNFGWRNSSGSKTFKADSGDEMLNQILPETECLFKIFIDKETKKISINNAHHDSPSWDEWYHITVASQ